MVYHAAPCHMLQRAQPCFQPRRIHCCMEPPPITLTRRPNSRSFHCLASRSLSFSFLSVAAPATMQRAVQSVKHAPAARCTARRPLAASSSRVVAVRRVQRLQAAQVSALAGSRRAAAPPGMAHCAQLAWSPAAGERGDGRGRDLGHRAPVYGGLAGGAGQAGGGDAARGRRVHCERLVPAMARQGTGWRRRRSLRQPRLLAAGL